MSKKTTLVSLSVILSADFVKISAWCVHSPLTDSHHNHHAVFILDTHQRHRQPCQLRVDLVLYGLSFI